jgi:hypothetical protein
MSVLIRYAPSSLTRDQYDKVNETMLAQGEWPEALQLHVLFGDEPNLRVSEIWSSEEEWRDMWNGPLGEALSSNGVKFASDPEILTVHQFVGSALPR